MKNFTLLMALLAVSAFIGTARCDCGSERPPKPSSGGEGNSQIAIQPQKAQEAQKTANSQASHEGTKDTKTENGFSNPFIETTDSSVSIRSTTVDKVLPSTNDLIERHDVPTDKNVRSPLSAVKNNLRSSADNISVVKFHFDAFGNRAVKEVDENRTVYFNIGTNQLEAYDIANAIASSTIYEPGIDQPLCEIDVEGNVKFYHQNSLGSVVAITNESAEVVESYSYDAWGTPSKDQDPSDTNFLSRFLYTGREYDAETKLYHYRARAYSPELGRFLQIDPIDFSAGDTNLYRYCGNSPVNFRDPMGLWTLGLGGQASGGIVGGGGISASVSLGWSKEKGFSFGAGLSFAGGIHMLADASLTGFIEITDAQSVDCLKGKATEVGGGIDVGLSLGADRIWGKGYGGVRGNLGIGLGFPIGVHYYNSFTF